jgi:hypothetical protein
MKRFLTSSSLVALFSFGSSSAMAHAGHVADESLHGPLHLEHVIALLIIGVAVVVLKKMSSK